MEKKYKVIYSQLFYEDLRDVVDYITNILENKIAAQNLVNEIEIAILERAKAPESYEIYKSTIKRKDIYYRIYVKNYTIFYVVKDDVMEIRRLLYSRKNFKNIEK